MATYPYIERVDTGKTRTSDTVDFSKYSEDCHIMLCSVPWDTEYHNVVAWENQEKREQWFAGLPASDTHYITNAEYPLLKGLEVFSNAFGHTGKIKIDFAYDVAYNFNYLQVKQPVLPDWIEDSGKGLYRREFFYYFIKGINLLSPQTVELTIELDTWTTFLPDVTFANAEVLEGHWFAKAAPKTDTFLADPINNTRYLTYPEPEIEVSQGSKTGAAFANLMTGNMYAVFACAGDLTVSMTSDSMTVSNNDLYDISWAARTDGKYESAQTYEVNAARDGISITTVQSRLGYSYPIASLWAVAIADIGAFCDWQRANNPLNFKSCECCYLLSDKWINLQSAGNVGGISIYKAFPKNESVYHISLSRGMYGYPTEYQGITKLYTSMFAKAVISPISGKQGENIEIDIENITSTSQIGVTALIYSPLVKFLAGLKNVGGTQSASVSMVQVDKSSIVTGLDLNTPNTSLDIDIPIYGVYVRGAELELAKIKAKNAILDAEIALEKNRADFEMYGERRKSNLKISPARANKKRSAGARQANENRSAGTALTNKNNSAANTRANALLSNTRNKANIDEDIKKITADRVESIRHTTAVNTITNNTNKDTRDKGNENDDRLWKYNWNSGYSNAAYVGGAALSGFGKLAINSAENGKTSESDTGSMQAASVGGDLPSIAVMLAKNQIMYSAIMGNMQREIKDQCSKHYRNAMYGVQTGRNNEMDGSGGENPKNITNMAKNTTDNVKAKQTRNKTVDDQIANANYGADTANASREYSAAVTNAAQTLAAENTAADYDYNAGYDDCTDRVADIKFRKYLEASKRGLKKAELVAEAYAADIAKVGEASHMEGARAMGYKIGVKRASDDCIMRAAAKFARKGYTGYNILGTIAPQNLKIAKQCTYWRLGDVTVVGKNINESNKAILKAGLIQPSGFYAWSSPEDIAAGLNLFQNLEGVV